MTQRKPMPLLRRPARLSELMRDHPVKMQRHIHTFVIRAVGGGQLRGIKLQEAIMLPHRDNAERMVRKSDVAFAAEDVEQVELMIARIVRRYSKKSNSGNERITFDRFCELSAADIDALYAEQLQADMRLRRYGQERLGR